jgi:hypothetical protein
LDFCYRLGQPQINNLHRKVITLQAHYDIAWFDVSVNQALFVHRAQTGGHLSHDFERQLHVKTAGTSYHLVQRFPIDEFHRVKVSLAALP